MEFILPCECGQSHTVSGGLAGTSFACSCGRTVKIPSLHILRERAGEAPIPIPPDVRIVKLTQSGELPGSSCLACGCPAHVEAEIVATCEEAYRQDAGILWWAPIAIFLLLLIRPVGLLIALALREGPTEQLEHGRTTSVVVPVTLCRSCLRSQLPSRAHVTITWLAWGLLLLGVYLLWQVWIVGLVMIGLSITFWIAGQIVAAEYRSRIRELVSRQVLYAELLQHYPETKLAYRATRSL